MGLRENLAGNPVEKEKMEDFIRRYEEDEPEEGYTDEEAWDRYRQVSPYVTMDEYRDAAVQAVGRLSKDQRKALVKLLKDLGAKAVIPELGSQDDGELAEWGSLTELVVRMREHEPKFLSAILRSGAEYDDFPKSHWWTRIFGGDGTGAARALMGGIAASASKKALSG